MDWMVPEKLKKRASWARFSNTLYESNGFVKLNFYNISVITKFHGPTGGEVLATDLSPLRIIFRHCPILNSATPWIGLS
jgi:hypothetical protein